MSSINLDGAEGAAHQRGRLGDGQFAGEQVKTRDVRKNIRSANNAL
jgi:hypothetical protein